MLNFKFKHRSCCCLVTESSPTFLRPCRLWPSRPLCPWNFPGKNTGVGCRFLLQGIFPIQGLNLPALQADPLVFAPPGKPPAQMWAHLHVGQHIHVQMHMCVWGSIYTCTRMAQHVNVHVLTCDSTSMCVTCLEWFRYTCEVGVSLNP